MSTNLCEQCQVLHLSAQSLGLYGFRERGESDELHLQFPHGQQSVAIRYNCRDDLPDLPLLRASAEAGCRFCALLRDSLMRGIAEEGPHRWVLKRYVGKKLTVKVAKLSMMAAYRSSDVEKSKFAAICVEWDILEPGRDRSPNDFTGPDGRIYFKLCAYPDDPLARYLGIAYPHPNQDPLSVENVKAIRDQLRDCEANHNHVASNLHTWNSSDSLPSRLIKITDGQDGKMLRLVDTKGPENIIIAHGPDHREPADSVKYVALSYRWGKDEFLTTTPNNLSDHYSDIPLSPASPDDTKSTLPRGFRDVVNICCELGIFYLWIDSLCIIQKETNPVQETVFDSQKEASQRDWARESAKMHNIYMSSYLTIFLVATDTPLQSVLQRPAVKPDSMVAIKYAVENHPQIRGSFVIQPLSYTGELDHLVWNPFLAAEDGLDSSVWNTRAWTLQERLLSPRKLYIGVTDMLGLGFFTCPERTDYGRDIEDIKRPRRHKSLDKLAIGASVVIGNDHFTQEQEEAKLYQTWYRIVEDYTCRDLTVSTDKLPALSGVAQMHALAFGNQYTAGLWVQDLASGLLWAPRYAMNPGSDRYFGERERKPLSRAEEYRGPSWSWCANDGQVEFIGHYLHRARSEIEVLALRLFPEYRYHPYGQLAFDQEGGGYLTLNAKVRAAQMEAQYEPRPDIITLQLPAEIKPESLKQGFQLRRIQIANATGGTQGATIFLDHAESYPDAEEVYLMIVARGD
ncbi:hypothetical protein BO71DRAFT_364883 [Aspergillus ellipticus CBS 707.79]|uniref:Heterokaryon incompatibility domain-containing protein n=1 Tax=Aspergillus ellipticus CBS 707.79 TaxID=1448320 RepID=A0A319CVT1_9EURO|nr:hypothetical protein BO71DRAFT_364883 [Aspergillus ellipticus CBS 707.79]